MRMKRVASFQVFLQRHKSQMQTCYPFLSASQIQAKLRQQWKNLDGLSQLTLYSKTVITKKCPHDKLSQYSPVTKGTEKAKRTVAKAARQSELLETESHVSDDMEPESVDIVIEDFDEIYPYEEETFPDYAKEIQLQENEHTNSMVCKCNSLSTNYEFVPSRERKAALSKSKTRSRTYSGRPYRLNYTAPEVVFEDTDRTHEQGILKKSKKYHQNLLKAPKQKVTAKVKFSWDTDIDTAVEDQTSITWDESDEEDHDSKEIIKTDSSEQDALGTMFHDVSAASSPQDHCFSTKRRLISSATVQGSSNFGSMFEFEENNFFG